MKFISKLKMLTIVTGLCAIAGCVSAPINLPAINAKEVDLTQGREVVGKSCGFQLLLLIPININGRYEDAFDTLKGQAGRDLLANLRIEESWFYGFVGTGYCTKLTATAYPRIGQSGGNKAQSEKSVSVPTGNSNTQVDMKAGQSGKSVNKVNPETGALIQ